MSKTIKIIKKVNLNSQLPIENPQPAARPIGGDAITRMLANWVEETQKTIARRSREDKAKFFGYGLR
jgi:hypothetical protein